eukprot:TRINITY_DN24226_c0_g1_i1.p1 TRINITY_DN24226_c0_g1~~TRINITY_DN24226_c0_g1_i1.p1  ORF type:complete len:500 (+),score=52.44 TRINITY_DN24226_c0_g1_i1:55-1554(+)
MWLRTVVVTSVWVLGRGSCGCGPFLEAEVLALRTDPLDFVVKLGEPYPARQVLTNQKLRFGRGNKTCLFNGTGETWRLKVDINIEKGSYRNEYRVIFEVPDSYPRELPIVRFGSKISNVYLRQLDEVHTSVATARLESMMQAALPADHIAGNLRGILQVLYRMLRKPPKADTEMARAWRRAGSDSREASEVIRKYRRRRKHERLFSVKGFSDMNFPDPVVEQLRLAIANISGLNRTAALASLIDSGVVQEVVPSMVYSFEVFTTAFCDMLMEEINNFYSTKLPARRPNSMNNYGIILNEIGLAPLMFAIQDEIIQPLAAVLFPTEGSELEGHHAFTIRYKGGEDTHLDVHTDDSDVTFNVNIFDDYAGCPLVFCGLSGAPDHRRFRTAYQHKLGYAVMHSGRHRHGAEDIEIGERMNLVIWSYSYNFRSSAASKKKHKRELGPPDLRCLSYTHDRDYGVFKKYPPGKRSEFFGRGWCPQKGKEYKGFVPEGPTRSRSEL